MTRIMDGSTLVATLVGVIARIIQMNAITAITALPAGKHWNTSSSNSKLLLLRRLGTAGGWRVAALLLPPPPKLTAITAVRALSK